MKKNRYKKEIIDTIKFILLLIVIVVVFKLVFTYVPPLNKYDLYVIKTDSMDPIILPGDIVVIKEIDSGDIKVGDIMAFHVDINGDNVDDVVVHYIAEINSNNNELIFKTKPHVSELHDRWTIEEQDLIGIYTYQVNYLGKIIMFAQSWVGKIILVADVIIISVIYDVLFSKKKKTKIKGKKDDIENISVK